MRDDDYRNITWDLEDVIRLLEDAAEFGVASAGITRDRGELQEALGDELGELSSCVAGLLGEARTGDAADWNEREQELMRRFDTALEPIRESFGSLHDAISGDSAAPGDVEDAVERLRALQRTLEWAQDRASESS